MNKCFIIAEIGVNHNGKLSIAKQLVDVAKNCGADAVKFQTFKAELLVNEKAKTAEYQKETTDYNTQFEMLKELELSYESFRLLKLYCDEVGIEFISTPFDKHSVDMLDKIGIQTYKVGSGDLTNYQLLKHIALKQKKVILSSGMSSLYEVIDSVNYLKKNRLSNKDIVILHCLSSYPAINDELNMRAILTMKHRFPEIEIGFSDHTLGYHGAIVAIALGAKYIEKHITLDNSMIGPDHRASSDPIQFKEYINKIRETEKMLGNGIKRCMSSEEKNKNIVRRSLAICRNMKKGEIIKEEDLICLRPDNNISSIYYEDMIGKELAKDIQKYEFLDSFSTTRLCGNF